MQDLADTGRLFNDQTANLHSPATGGAADVNHGARHAPHVPRVRVFQAIRDGVTVPVVKWTFSDAKCNHTQAAAEVRVNDGLIAAGALDGPFSRTLSPVGTAYSVQVKVFDNEGFSSSRTVLVQP